MVDRVLNGLKNLPAKANGILGDFRSGEPLLVGTALTKAFGALVLILAILPQHTSADGWEWRILAFLTSPPNGIGDTLAGLAGVLAFMWIIITVWLQSQELSAQRKELKATRKEVRLSRKAYEKTNTHLDQQRFESLFFEILTTHNSIVNSMDLRKTDTGEVISSGRDCFKSFAKDLSPVTWDTEIRPEKSDKNYLKLYKDHHSDLGHYFRFLYNRMRVVSESKFATKTHKRLFRAVFSDDELLIIFYNARSFHGAKMIKYIEDFELFDNLPQDRIFLLEHKDHFSTKCFGEPK